jgi:hypothetical protein
MIHEEILVVGIVALMLCYMLCNVVLCCVVLCCVVLCYVMLCYFNFLFSFFFTSLCNIGNLEGEASYFPLSMEI